VSRNSFEEPPVATPAWDVADLCPGCGDRPLNESVDYLSLERYQSGT